jgi:hypothetical protein
VEQFHQRQAPLLLPGIVERSLLFQPVLGLAGELRQAGLFDHLQQFLVAGAGATAHGRQVLMTHYAKRTTRQVELTGGRVH